MRKQRPFALTFMRRVSPRAVSYKTDRQYINYLIIQYPCCSNLSSRNSLPKLYLCVLYNDSYIYIYIHVYVYMNIHVYILCMSGVLCKFIVNILVLANLSTRVVFCTNAREIPEFSARFACVCRHRVSLKRWRRIRCKCVSAVSVGGGAFVDEWIFAGKNIFGFFYHLLYSTALY